MAAEALYIPDSLWRAITDFLANYRELAAAREVNSQLYRAVRGLKRHPVLRDVAVPETLSLEAWRAQYPEAMECNIRGRLDVTDVSCLTSGGQTIHTLIMSDCWNVTDVSALSGIHTLDMGDCNRVTDVSALAGIHWLNMSGCNRVTDVSALAGIHTLYMGFCTGITDVSCLTSGGRTIHMLNMNFCRGITDLSAPAGIHTLNMDYFTGITGVSCLAGIRALYMSFCWNVSGTEVLEAAGAKIYK
jgi:hypothetical protein